MRFLASLLVTVVTNALVRSHHVLADSVGTYSAGAGAFVDIFAGSSVGRQFMTGRTLAFETSGCIDAFTSAAEARGASTLVDIHANLHHHSTLESFLAVAGEATVGVLASAVSANSSHDVAFIDIVALDAVLVDSKTLVTSTREAANAVFTTSVITHVGELDTLVDVFAVDVAVTFGAQLLESR